MDIDKHLQEAVQSYWNARAQNKEKQVEAGRIDAGTRSEVTGGTQMGALETLVADILCEAGLKKFDVKTRTALQLPGYYRGEKKWDLLVIADNQLVVAMEFKSHVGSFGKNFNNRCEEAIGSASDVWVAYREKRLGGDVPPPFLGYFFLLEDHPDVHTPVRNAEPYFEVDPVFKEASYSKRYQILCERLVLERLYNAASFMLATNTNPTQIRQPASHLTFQRLVAALRGHVVTYLGTRRPADSTGQQSLEWNG